MMITRHSKWLVFSSLIAAASACKKDDKKQTVTVAEETPVSAAETFIASLSGALKEAYDSAPSRYTFERDGNDTVDTTGQVFRQLLIEDLKTFIATLKRSSYTGSQEDLLAALDSYYTYAYDNSSAVVEVIKGSSTFKLTAKGISGNTLAFTEGALYQNIQDPGKHLREKTAGNDNPLLWTKLKGWNTQTFHGQDLSTIDADKKGDSFVEPEDLLQAWFKIVAAQAVDGQPFVVANGDQPEQMISEAYITEDGLDLSQLVQKFLHASVSYSQATGDYLNVDLGQDKGLNVDNTTAAKAGVSYTNLEHHWDEAFGYFGAARDFLAYTDQQTADGLSLDTDGNGTISLIKEKNLGISVNTAKRDLGAKDGSVDFSRNAMTAFIKGRHLISTKPEGYLDAVKALAIIAASQWEKTLGATVVHYINDVIHETGEFGTSSYLFKDHAKYFSELKGFALAFQFNPYSTMTEQDFDTLHSLLGDKPVLPSAGEAAVAEYMNKLKEARSLLQKIYGFSETNTLEW